MSDELDVAGWIESGTVKRTTVVIYNDPALASEAEALVAERDQIEARVKAEGGDRSLADSDPFADIDARLEALSERFEESRSEWVLAPVVADDYDAILGANPDPALPRKPLPGDPESKWDHYQALVAQWKVKREAVELERNLAYIAASVCEIRAGGKSASSVTPNMVRALRSRPHGKAQFEHLLAEAIAVTNGEVQMPIPKSSSTSTSTPS